MDNDRMPADDEGMASRIEKFEDFTVETRERLARIETRLDQMATRADLHELQSTMIKWLVGTVSGLGIAGITIMTFVLNNATPKAAAPSAPPIIITLPQRPATPQAE